MVIVSLDDDYEDFERTTSKYTSFVAIPHKKLPATLKTIGKLEPKGIPCIAVINSRTGGVIIKDAFKSWTGNPSMLDDWLVKGGIMQ